MDNLCSDYGYGEVDMANLCSDMINMQPKSITTEKGREVTMSTSWSTGQSGTCVMDKWRATVDESSPCSAPSAFGAPICRQFWKAGMYNADLAPVSKPHVGTTHLHVHPRFLHSNATSHKWAFGAIAELLDNAVDEIHNEATYVLIDKIPNPRNGSPALLIQDNGSGMDPEAMRKCMCFGFSNKLDSSIGKYGNGFKTSSMRLGADAIVFTRNMVDWTVTQSIGLLSYSYTFLSLSGFDRIVVPMVHYKYNFLTGFFEPLQPNSDSHSNLNLSMLLQWSPYSTEEELLKQFDDVGQHGTKIIVYNLWLDDDGNMELDFESDPKDIRLALVEKTKAKDGTNKAITENHLANSLHYSLRAYLSILYIKLPPTFSIMLRQNTVLYHNIATELQYPKYILYKPQKGGSEGGTVVTTIGFLKEAPRVKVHGFNIYHKRRLILPFLPVANVKGRGVVGVLEANFIEPTHSKQDFEKTNVFEKLVTRLKVMTIEYWDLHCECLGYTNPKKDNPTFASSSDPKEGSNLKRKSPDQREDSHSENVKGSNTDQKKTLLMQENKKLKQQCLDLETSEKELSLKAMNLKTVLEEARKEYAFFLTVLQLMDKMNVWEN